MKESGMKVKVILVSILFVFSLTALSCKQSSSPFDPGSLAKGQSGTASITGSIILAGTSITDFNLINVGIKGTDLAVNPDKNGNFRITQLPLGSLIIEIYVESNISDIPVDDVESGEEIQMAVEIQSDNSAVLASISRNKKSLGSLQLEIQPKMWNTDWENSDGGVHVQISGPGFDVIEGEFVKMVGPAGDELSPYKWEIGGVYFKAWFYKSGAIGIILDPKRGDTYNIQVTGNFTDVLMDSITIVGEKPVEADLSLEIKPSKWNIAWVDSVDEMSAHISGDGFDNIKPGIIKMSCALCFEPGDLIEISPSFEELGGSSYVAKFLQSEAIRLFKDPKRDETYDVKVAGEFNDSTPPFELIYTIAIIGKKSGVGPLTLEIKPDKWNMAWANGDEDGEVTARIKGEDFDKIDSATVSMSGPAGSPLTPDSTEIAGLSLMAKFSQSNAITLIPNSPLASSYDINVAGTLEDGTPFGLTYTVDVKAKK